MPSLTVKSPSGSRVVPLVKPITSVGAEGDIPVGALGGGGIAIEYDGRAFVASAFDGASLSVNGKRKDRAVLADGDTLAVGDSTLRFAAVDAAPEAEPAAPASTSDALEPVRRLSDFHKQLAEIGDPQRLLTVLLDRVIEVSHADKGFLILLEEGRPVVKAARNMAEQTLEGAVERMSDSILQKVLRTKRAIIVSDALHDPEFEASESVVNLKLSSVMCAPLSAFGTLLGAIYVGNDSVANLFEQRTLELLTVYSGVAALLVKNAMLVRELLGENADLKRRLEDGKYGDIIGACDVMREVYRKIDKIAQTDISVLITGETGTGKELIARELHRRSTRKSGPFITINCGAIPENLLESELFGHVRGAFTGAVATRNGRFQAANGGTLFLDEIGEMPPQLQVKLLRALQDKTVVKVGETRTETVDIRVLAATNKVLEEEIKHNRFREDLYYRLNVVKLHLPPLRERGDDIVVLAKYFLSRYTKEFDSKVKGFAPGALIALRKYAWPGNIRQLENRLKKAVVLAETALVTPEDLDIRPENLEPIVPLALAKEEFQKRYVSEILERNNGNRTKTAKDLGVDPRTIFRHLERMEAEREGRQLPPDADEEALP